VTPIVASYTVQAGGRLWGTRTTFVLASRSTNICTSLLS